MKLAIGILTAISGACLYVAGLLMIISSAIERIRARKKKEGLFHGHKEADRT